MVRSCAPQDGNLVLLLLPATILSQVCSYAQENHNGVFLCTAGRQFSVSAVASNNTFSGVFLCPGKPQWCAPVHRRTTL